MSIKVMTRVWESKLPKDEKFILLAYADWANDEGENVYPSIGRVAWKCGYSARHVQRVTRSLAEQGIMEYVGRGVKTRTGWTNRYRIHVGNLPARPDYGESRDDSLSPLENEGVTSVQQGVTPMHEGVTSTTPRGDMGDTRSIRDPLDHPSVEPLEASPQPSELSDLLPPTDNPLSATNAPELSRGEVLDYLDVARRCEEVQQSGETIQTAPPVPGQEGDPYVDGPLRAYCDLVGMEMQDAHPSWPHELRRVAELISCGPRDMELALRAIRAARDGVDVGVEGWWKNRGFKTTYIFEHKNDDGDGFSAEIRGMLRRARREGREWWAFPTSGGQEQGEPPARVDLRELGLEGR